MRALRSGEMRLLGSLMILLFFGPPVGVFAQTSTEATAESAEAAAIEEVEAEEPQYSEEELDDLVAPVALYPDPLLAQVLVAATYPIDVVKAGRWVGDNKEMPAGEREDAAAAEDWDPSVAVLAAGFPTVLDKMSTEIEWTEDLGDAVLVQSDDVLDAIQRQRARAAAVGNLESNAAQAVTVEEDNISIAPADPEVVYVPTYDSQAVYTTAPTTTPVVVQSTEPGFSSGDLILTGLLSFGAGLLVAEIFDDDDDHWYGYWGYHHHHHGRWMDWDDGYFHPRPGCRACGNDIDIDTGDITINRNRVDIDRDGRWRPDERRQAEARDKIRDRKGERRTGDRRAGDRDRSRDDLRNKMAERSKDAGALNLQGDRKPAAQRSERRATALGGDRDRGNSRASVTNAKKAKERGRESRERAGVTRRDAQPERRATQRQQDRPQVNRSDGDRKAQRKSSERRSAMSKSGGGQRAQRASNRGKASRDGRRRR